MPCSSDELLVDLEIEAAVQRHSTNSFSPSRDGAYFTSIMIVAVVTMKRLLQVKFYSSTKQNCYDQSCNYPPKVCAQFSKLDEPPPIPLAVTGSSDEPTAQFL